MSSLFRPESFVEMAKEAEKVASVTMITFNRWGCTSQSLASIFRNTFLPHTLTVVDNGSWDGTVEELQELRQAGRIDRLILLPENRGNGVGKNFGLRASEGKADWFCCIDNDIAVSPYWLSYLCYVSMFPGLGVIGSNVQGFGQPGGLSWYKLTHWKTVEGVILDNCPNPGGVYIVSASTFAKLGYFLERSLYGLEDSEFHSRQRHHGLRSAYVRNAICKQLPDEKFAMKDGISYREFKTAAHNAIVTKVRKSVKQGKHVALERYETLVTLQEVEKYTWGSR